MMLQGHRWQAHLNLTSMDSDTEYKRKKNREAQSKYRKRKAAKIKAMEQRLDAVKSSLMAIHWSATIHRQENITQLTLPLISGKSHLAARSQRQLQEENSLLELSGLGGLGAADDPWICRDEPAVRQMDPELSPVLDSSDLLKWHLLGHTSAAESSWPSQLGSTTTNQRDIHSDVDPSHSLTLATDWSSDIFLADPVLPSMTSMDKELWEVFEKEFAVLELQTDRALTLDG